METDIPWDDFDADKLTDEQAPTIKMNAITGWAALPATEMFLRDFVHDNDFSAFMSNLLGQTFANVRDLNKYRKQALSAA